MSSSPRASKPAATCGARSRRWCSFPPLSTQSHRCRSIAAGGIADGRGLAAALALGAQAGWVGTRFVASEEAGAHPEYKRLLMGARETDTRHSELFDIGWEQAPHRTLRNSTVRLWEDAGRPGPGMRPGEGEAVALDSGGEPIVRYSSPDPELGMTGDLEAMALYAGQSVGLIHEVLPAGEIVRAMAQEAERTLARLRG